jgi:Acetyltransferase (GNAT) domain
VIWLGSPPFLWDRKALLIGTGITDHLGLLYEPEFQNAVVSGVRECLWDRKADWDVCDFQELPSGSPLLKAGLEGGKVMEQSVCPTLALSDFRPNGTAKNLRTSRRNELRFQTARSEETDEYLDALFLLHSLRWANQGGRGVLSEPDIRRFHHLVADGFARRGYLRFHGLRLRGLLIAVLY